MKKTLYIFTALVLVIVVLLFLGRKHISTEIVINAPAERVWAALMDFKSYPEWNPFLKKVEGEIKRGGRISVTFHTAAGDPVVFTPEIELLEENSLFRWQGRLLMPGIFTGRHTFRLLKLDRGTTKLVQEEEFNGILVPFFSFDSTIDGFNAMNGELKKRVETAAK